MKLGVASLARLSAQVPVAEQEADEPAHVDEIPPTRFDREVEVS